MSRGIETIDTVLPTGSRLATIIVSVRAVLRPTPESTPMSRTVTRGVSGVPLGDRDSDGNERLTRAQQRRGVGRFGLGAREGLRIEDLRLGLLGRAR